jgi:hypothetical protein
MTFDEMQLILQQVVVSQRETQEIAKEAQEIARSNGRAIQAMMERTETDRLRHEERMAKYDEEIAELRFISRGLTNMLDSIDSDRPTILRKLNTIENKTDAIIERLNRQ